MITIQQIKEKVNDQFDFLRSVRHHLHRHPELSFRETETARYISGLLKKWGIEHQTGVAGNGVVALIKGKDPEKQVIALRADMDALPIEEQNDVEYRSVNAGVMHACGHDVHMTCLLGTAQILNELKAEFNGTVKLIFQPAEENLPGGAKQMIEEGVLKSPDVEAIVAQHVFPELEAGKVGFKSGIYMASSDEINIYVRGRGGHGAMPERGDDTVLAAAQIIVALQKIASRNAPPKIPTVLSFGKITGNGAHNVFPAEVAVHGTFRTFNEEWRKKAHALIEETAYLTAKMYGVECEVVIDNGYPVLINDETLTQEASEVAEEYLGKENVTDLEIRTTVEDFAYYTQQVPGCFYRLGVGNKEKGITSNVHTPTFDVDEESLRTGTGLMTWIAIKKLMKDE
jgi:amidohydrolase